MTTSCRFRRFLRTCGQPGVALCQYCGDSFCEQHGSRLADGQEICNRPLCQQKKADLERYFVHKEAVALRNGERLCGNPSCGRAPAGQCSKCRGFFCLPHLEAQEVEERRGSTVLRVRGSLCRHCVSRRRLWSQGQATG
ncbi:MAG: hypothetical protein A2148_00345 [Chloroflexi bacterium RBG_16_68_14]|nr:MAG: hypothetical protein A2148_00345 [Chloroflexi bacterium RBG_16_68_14]